MTKNKSTSSSISTSIFQQKGKCRMIQIPVFLLLSTLFLMCDKNPESDPADGHTREMQFGQETALVQEINFISQHFAIVGDLRMPVVGDVHPVIIMIHGSGGATRHGSVPFEPLIEIFLRNGFAVLSWDKPGSGMSKGEFHGEYKITERAKIIISAIQVLIDHPSIDHSSIGLWGISQAGWVMPKALGMTNNVAFMIVVSGGGEDGIEQTAYLVGQVAACAGESPENVENAERYWSQMAKASNYTEYKEAADILAAIPSIVDYTGIEVLDENEWNAWPQYTDLFFDPMDIIKQVKIPVLALYGELDKNVDPVQGAQAYLIALEEAGNEDYMIEVIEGAGHVLTPAQTGCLNESGSSEYVSEYLEILEDWLSSI